MGTAMAGRSGWRRFVETLEESVIAFIFAVMVLVTFSQVVARYVFNAGAVWALELTTFAFAWLVLIGISYGIRRSAHIGVDAFVRLFPSPVQRFFGLLAVLAGLAYAGIILTGAWEYVGKLYKIGIGAVDLPIPRWIPYSVLILSMVLMILRLLEAGWQIVRGERRNLLADEARDTIKEILGEEEPVIDLERKG